MRHPSTVPEWDLLTVNDVVTRLGCTRRTLYRHIKSHTIPCRKVGGRWFFRRDELDAWWQSQPGVPMPTPHAPEESS